jgi:hypothetical protein
MKYNEHKLEKFNHESFDDYYKCKICGIIVFPYEGYLCTSAIESNFGLDKGDLNMITCAEFMMFAIIK